MRSVYPSHGRYIENISETGVANESMDLVISNCVVNLSPDKPAVIQGACTGHCPAVGVHLLARGIVR